MVSADLLLKWRKTEAHLRQAIIVLEKENGPFDTAEVMSLLEHNELGLACDQLEWICEDQDLSVSKSAEDRINDAKRLMGVFRGDKGANS